MVSESLESQDDAFNIILIKSGKNLIVKDIPSSLKADVYPKVITNNSLNFFCMGRHRALIET